MRFQKIAVAALALLVAALAGVLICREAFRPQISVSSLETGCRSATDTECVKLVNRCHRSREAEACRALGRLPHMKTKLENVRRATRAEPGHPAHDKDQDALQ